MMRLMIIRAAIAVWVRSIRISDKLRPVAWKALTCASILLFAISCWVVVKSLQNTQRDGTETRALRDRPYSLEAGLSPRSTVFLIASNREKRPIQPQTSLIYSTYLAGSNGQDWNREIWKTSGEASGDEHFGLAPGVSRPSGMGGINQIDFSGYCFSPISISSASWLNVDFTGSKTNDVEISHLIDVAQSGQASRAILGSEVLQRHDLTEGLKVTLSSADADSGMTVSLTTNGATLPRFIAFSDWLQVDFNGSRNINEIEVFTLQDNYPNPAGPTQAMTFSLYGLTPFDVQYWNGSSWVLPRGSGTNDREIAHLIDVAQAASIIRAPVGSETLLRRDLTESQEISANRWMTLTLASNGSTPLRFSPLHSVGAPQTVALLIGNSGLQETSDVGLLQARSILGFEPVTTPENDYLARLKQLTRRDSSVQLQLLLTEDSLRQDLLFWTSLFSLIGSLITSIANIVFAWISLHRRRADEITLRLRIQERDQEIQQLKIALEKAHQKAEADFPGIIIVSS